MVTFVLYADCESADLDVVKTAVIDGIVAATRLASEDVLDVQVSCGSIKVDVTLKNEAFAAQVESAIATKTMTVEVNGVNVAPVLMAASLYREENLSDDVGGSTGTVSGGKSNGDLAKVVVPVVLVSLVMFIVANIVFRRTSLNADDGGMNGIGRPQTYENPAYDASSPGDANGNLQFTSAPRDVDFESDGSDISI